MMGNDIAVTLLAVVATLLMLSIGANLIMAHLLLHVMKAKAQSVAAVLEREDDGVHGEVVTVGAPHG